MQKQLISFAQVITFL